VPASASSYKLQAPRVARHLRRGAQLRDLGEAVQAHPLTWVMGLPGAGKTSLVACWLAESATPAIWYRLDESDADVAALFAAITEAAGADRRLPEWSPEHQADLARFSERFFSELAGEPLRLVLDDCHRVADDSPALAVLETAQRVCGEHLRIVAISRRAPPPALERGRFGGWLGWIDDLRLGEEEAGLLFEAARGRPLDVEEREHLAEADGWLAHVLAVARAAPDAGAARTPLSRRGPARAGVGEFLAAELLESLPEVHRAGLRRLAELPEIPRSLAATNGGAAPLSAEAARLLDALAQQRHFVDATMPDRWRLHDLLRDTLRATNVREDDAETLKQVRRSLAGSIAGSMPDAAMELRLAAHDAHGVAQLLETHGPRWLADGRHRSVVEWVMRLGAEVEPETRAVLSSWHAQALLPIEPEAARPLFAQARHQALVTHDARAAYAAWCGEVASYVVQWGAVQGLADLVDDLESLHAVFGEPSADIAFRTNADALTALMYGRAEDPRIGRYAEATARAIAHAPDAGARITAAGQLLIYRLWWAGDYPGGRALYDAFDAEVASDDSLAPLPRLVWWSCASIVDWQCGKPEDCYAKVGRGLALAEASGVHVRDFFLLTQGMFCALSQDDWPRAEQYLALLARTERTHRRLDTMVFHFFRSWYCLGRGDPQTALAHAQAAWPLAEAMGSMFHKVIVLSALAPACLHCGDVEGAQRAYREQLALAKAARNPTFSFIAFCAGAEIAMLQGDTPALARQLERMLTVKQLGGFHSGCGWRTPMMRDLLAFALEQRIVPDVARRWIREKRIAPPLPVPPGWPLPVRVLALDGLQVRLEASDDAATAAAGKSAAKLRELLAVLVAERRGVSLGDLAEWLWPEAEGDRATASLKVAIHRLRQWLGADAIKVQGSVAALNATVVGCDLWDAEDALAAAASPLTARPERVLHGIDLPPVHALRRRLGRLAAG